MEWSDRGVLRSRFTSLDCPAGYLYGTGSGDPARLELAGVPVAGIPGSGHFPMVDNPDALWQAVAGLLPGAAPWTTPEPAISTIRR